MSNRAAIAAAKAHQAIMDMAGAFREAERKRIIAMAEAKVCFGHQETGNCEHSVCFGMRNLISKIEAAE